jgi:apolipoprotein N-acyltransferase
VAWVAFIPWLAAVVRPAAAGRSRAARGFVLGLVLGAAYFATTLYWIPDVLVTYGGIARLLAIPVSALLVAYLALFPAAASWVVARSVGAHGARGLWIAPVAWVASEWLRGWLFTGFPWVLVGYSQASWLAIAQAASVAGVLGLSGLVLAVNVAVFVLLQRQRTGWRGAVAVLAGAAALAGWGAWRLSRPLPPGEPLRVGVVQGNVPQDQKWSPEFAHAILSRYLRLSREAAAQGAELIVWPESATPFFYEEDPAGADAIRQLARETGAWLLFGSDQLERGPTPRYYNAAFAVSPDGRTTGVYRKQHLVPFGEYVPLKSFLFFVAPLVEAVSDFSPGTETVLLPVNGRPVTTAICYEVIFGDLMRDAVVSGSQLLTTITNDAWYGRSSAPWQHFEQASLRAIEQERYLVRAANTGISGVVDPRGRVIAQEGLFETGTLVADVRHLEGRTIYSRIGDSFAWACAVLTVLAIATSSRRRGARP